MPITLESRVRRMQVFNLPHEAFCKDACACSDTTVVIVAEHPRTGDRARKHVAKRVPASMTWLARERRAGLPSVLLEVPDIQAAIERGYLRVVEQTPDRADASASPTTSAPAAFSSAIAAAPSSPAAAAAPSPTAAPASISPAGPTSAPNRTAAPTAPAAKGP
jgi:hypothetical protein